MPADAIRAFARYAFRRGERPAARLALLRDGQPDPDLHGPCLTCGSAGPPVAMIVLRVPEYKEVPAGRSESRE